MGVSSMSYLVGLSLFFVCVVLFMVRNQLAYRWSLRAIYNRPAVTVIPDYECMMFDLTVWSYRRAMEKYGESDESSL